MNNIPRQTLTLIVGLVVAWAAHPSIQFSRADDLASNSLGSPWQEDFTSQPVSLRPSLEVNYTDASRTAFQILAAEYRLTGQLEKPHLLVDGQEKTWLWMEMQDEQGQVYSTQLSKRSSRINLYRRGPYYCEVHWFDLQLATEQGKVAPLKGDLALFCYPEKILAEVTWHGTGDFAASSLHIKGIAPKEVGCFPFKKGTRQAFAFSLFGEKEPLPDSSFVMHQGKVPVHYDARKGCYFIGTVTSSSFQKQFYDIPNRYETASFTVKNDSVARKIYVCHESVVGGAIVEGGIVLDEDGHPTPITVQISKNFAGEKEEKFYNPHDTSFSETFFPLYLKPGEERTLTSLHLYQNWGRHMTKHWSSLGAWMDYFHSSTGVTETTCYVPFKFAGIGGVSIADFRAMSQETFWIGQPQHNNLAGHSFLSFYDGERWQHSKYVSTTYRSTGPNWYDIQLKYISTDGIIKVTVDIWETPQVDELRSFFHVRCEVLKPLAIEDAKANFRFLSVTSAVQHLRFSRFAASGTDDLKIDFSKSPFPVKGLSLPEENAYLALYGDHVMNRGSNAIVIRKFSGPRGIGPAASLQTGRYQRRSRLDKKEDTRLLLVPDVERLELQAGDIFEIDGFWLPYGSTDDAETPRRETVTYGIDVPKVTSCATGTVISDLPVKVQAHGNRAEFSIQGGKDLLPVIVTGLTDWKYARIWKKEEGRWRLLSHARNTVHDGYQVFCEEGGTFGAVFLVASDEKEQTLKVIAGDEVSEGDQIVLKADSKPVAGGKLPSVTILDPEGHNGLRLSYPETASGKGPAALVRGDRAVQWKSSEGHSVWFESNEGRWKRGGRINPNQDDLDLEYWWQNSKEGIQHADPEFSIDLKGTPFADPQGDRTWNLTASGWQKVDVRRGETIPGSGVIAVQAVDGSRILCMAWPKSSGVMVAGGLKMGVALEPITFSRNRRYHVRGKVYLLEGSLELLKDRINKETNIR